VNLRSNAPQVNVIKSDINDTQGSAFLTDVGDNLMQISGIAPSSGVMTVRVVVARAEDNKRVVTEFNVRSSQLQRPTLPQRMYPGITYEFNPNLAFLTGQELRAVLAEPSKDGTRETKERYSSPQGSAFVFTPAEGDAGKTLVFERYINGRRVGEVYTVPVEDFAGPEVLEITPQSRILLVRTKCSGMVRGDMNRVTFDASKLSNAIVAERFGDIIRNESLQETIQLFEIRRAEPDKPVTGAFRVVDKKNRASAVKSAER
jgi:hypothetical protein